MNLAIDVVAIILSVTATVITVVGFFASLRFYREGIELQGRAQGLLSRIDERIASVQTQMGGVFDKTLDAAIARTTPAAAAKDQERLIEENVPRDPKEEEEPSKKPMPSDLVDEILKYFHVQNARYTDVSSDEVKWVFNLGARQGFSLFDRPNEFIFFRYFDEGIEEAVLRTRLVLETMDAEWKRYVADNPLGPSEWVKRILETVSITILVPDGADLSVVRDAIDRFRPEWRDIPVTVLDRATLRERIDAVYSELGLPDEGRS